MTKMCIIFPLILAYVYDDYSNANNDFINTFNFAKKVYRVYLCHLNMNCGGFSLILAFIRIYITKQWGFGGN